MILAIIVLAEIAFTTLWLFRSRRILPPALLLVGSAVWVVVNRPLEGPVLWVLVQGHGLTAADLLCPIGVALAAVGWRRARKHKTSPPTI